MKHTTAKKLSAFFLLLLLLVGGMGAAITRLDFRPLAAVHLIKSNGQVLGYGFGASTDTARGTALAAAFSALSAGDTIEVGPGTFSGISSTLELRAGCTLRGRGQDATTIKLADSANVALLSNKNIVATASASATDTNLTIADLTLDGNGSNQTRGTLSPAVAFKPILRCWGVDGVTLKNVTFQYPANFSAWFADWKNVVCDNVNIVTATGVVYTDGLHFNGSGQYLTIRNIRGNSYDDFLALNADDDAALFSPYSVTFNGAIRDVLVDGWQMKDPLLGCRLLSSGTANGTGTGSVIDRVIVRNVTGTALNTILHADGYGGGDSQIGSVTLDTVDVSIHDPTVYVNGANAVLVNQLVKNLTVRNFKKSSSPYVCPAINVLGSGNVSTLTVDGLQITEAGAAATSQIIVSAGAYVGNFCLSNVSSYNSTKRTTGAIVNNAGHMVFGLTASNVSIWQTGYLLYSTSDCGDVVLANCRSTCNNPPTLVDNVPLVQLSGASATVTSLTGSNVRAAAVVTAVSGASTPSVNGDAIGVASGTYTPTFTAGANVDAATPYAWQWSRVGNVVTISGRFDIDPHSASSQTQLAFSLPIASDIQSVQDVGGVAAPSSNAGSGCAAGAIKGDAANDRAYLDYYCGTNVLNQEMMFTAAYTVR